MEKAICLRGFSRYQISARRLEISQIYQCRKQALHITTKCSAVPLPHLAAPGPPPSPPEQATNGSNSSSNHRKRKLDQLANSKATGYRYGKGSSILQNRFWKEVNIREGEGMEETLPRKLTGLNLMK